MQEPVEGHLPPFQHLRIQISVDIAQRFGTLVGLHLDVFCLDPRFAILDDDHWSADSPTITGNMYCLLVMVDVHPDEFIDLSCSPELPEVIDETSRVTGNTDDGAIDMNNEGSRGIDLCPCCE